MRLFDPRDAIVAANRADRPNPMWEPLLFARDVDQPQITLEPAFLKYVRRWVLSPTVDATSHSLHCLRIAGTLEEWLARHRDLHRLLLSRCIRDAGFAVAPDEASPSLYATVNAMNVMKALIGKDEGTPLVKCQDEARTLLGDSLLDRVAGGALDLLDSCAGEHGVVDAPTDTEPTTHALYFAILVLWNLGLTHRAAEHGLSEARASEFVDQCKEPYEDDERQFGFVANPQARRSSGQRKPCTTTSAMVLLGFNRAKWSLPFETEPVFRFFRSMEQGGGFRVFPGEPVTLSATTFTIVALDALHSLNGERVPSMSFVRSCQREDGGFAFSPRLPFSSNANCTRYGLRALEHLCRVPEYLPAHARSEVTRYIATLFDREEGGFWGYDVRSAPSAEEHPDCSSAHAPQLSREESTFEEQLEGLLSESPGSFALVKDDRIAVFETQHEAIEAGYRLYGRDPFLVRRIESGDRALRLSTPL